MTPKLSLDIATSSPSLQGKIRYGFQTIAIDALVKDLWGLPFVTDSPHYLISAERILQRIANLKYESAIA